MLMNLQIGDNVARRRKKAPTLAELHPDWVISDKVQINGRNVTEGTEVTITDVRGRFRFIKHVQTPTAEWIDVIGGPNGHKTFRSFRTEQVRRVHWKNKMRENAPDPA